MRHDPTLIGTVQDVTGTSVTVALVTETMTGLTFVSGESYRIGQVGGFVRIPLGHTSLYGIVSQVGAGAAPDIKGNERPLGSQWLTVQLVGERGRLGHFERGVSQHPTINDSVHIVTQEDLETIYGPGEPKDFVSVGTLASAESIPALIDINKLLTRHAAVVGTTGSGKSTTVAGLLNALSAESAYPSARLLVLDIHGEYAKALEGRCVVFRVSPDVDKGERALHVPYWALNCEEFFKFGLGALESKDAAPVQDRLADMKRAAFNANPMSGLTPDGITVDTPIPFSVHQLWYDLHCEMAATFYDGQGQPQSRATWALEKEGNDELVGDVMHVVPPKFKPHKNVANEEKIRQSQSPLSIRRQVDLLASRLRDPRFDFLFRPGEWLPDPGGRVAADLDTLLRDWLGTDRPITLLDLSGIPSTILHDLVGALLRIIYDAMFWARNIPEGTRQRPLLVVLEEAHAYLGKESTNAASTAVRRIAKEGRKYGVGLLLVSQRPSEIDATILSQCGTIFAMRLANDTDRGHVTGAASDNLKGLFDMLPVLRTGEAIIVGEAVTLPIRALIEPPPKNRRPDSQDPRVVVRGDPNVDGFDGEGGWNVPRREEDYSIVVRQWRKQTARYEHATADATPAEAEGGE